MAATIYSYNSNNRYCTYTLSMVRNGSTVTITASGSIYTKNTNGGDSSGTVYAQLRYGVSPAQTAENPAKGSTAAKTEVENYGTLVSNATGTGDNQGWTIQSVVTKGNTTNTYSSTKIVTGPVDNSSSPSNPYNFTITWTKTTNNAINWSNVALFFSKHQTNITVGDYPSYAFVGTEGDLKAHYARYHTDSLSVGVGFTAVGAPTSVTTSMSLQKPGANVLVSWSGATAGTSNSINGYQVYGGTSSNPTTLLATVSSTGTSSSYTYTIPSDATRGSTYYFRVKTTGSAGSSYYSGYSSQVSCKVNTLPTAPTITLSGTTILNNVNYIKSNGTATFSLSSSDADGHAITYYRNTTNSTSGATAITGSSWSTSTGGTYYFWAKDSLGEYSSVSSKSFTKNVKPSADGGNLTLARTNQYTSNQITNWLKDYYYTAGKATITGVTSTCGVASYTWNIRTYDYSGGATTPTFNNVVKDYTSTTTTTNSCNYSYPTNGDWGKAYKIRCIITDKLGEQSSEIISEGYCVIPPAPSLDSDIWNTLNLSDVNGSLHKSFYQYMSTEVDYIDSSVTVEPTISGNAQVRLNDTTSFSSSGKIPLVISNTAQWTTYTLTLSLKSAWRGTSTFNSETYNITRTGAPKVQIDTTIRNFTDEDITLHGTEVKPFTSVADLNFSFKLGLPGYNFTENALENASTFLFANSTKVRIKEKKDRKTTDGERYIYTQQGGENSDSGLYNWNTNTLNLNMNSDTNSVSFRIEFTNVFGELFYYTKSGLNFNFIEPPTVGFAIGSSAGSTQGTIIKEGNTITYTPNITLYNTDKAVTIKTYIYRSTSTNSQTGGSWELYNGTNPNNGITYIPSRGTSTASAITYNTPITYTVGEIIESKYLYFKISITYGTTTTDSQIPTTYYVSQRHKSITLPFTPTFSNNKFSYISSLTDRGGGLITTSASDKAAGLGTVNYGLQFSQTNDFSIIKTQDTTPIPNKKYYYINNGVYVEFEGETFVQGVEYYEITYQWLDSEGNLVTSINPTWCESSSGGAASYSGDDINLGSGWSFYNIRAVYQTNIGSVTKTSYSSVIAIYATAPTISYRKNQIGININGIEQSYTDSAVVIGSTTGKTKVKLVAANNIATINLENGTLDGFIFDGGTWDQS